tara:strand:+ start:1322 stop:2473 length:1152 start_codon:yes stop_codon:yes gene_type:complete
MAKALLVDTNFSSAPIYSVLQGLGYDVHVVGSNPIDALAKSANNFWNIDYSDTTALYDLIERENFDYLIPGCTDRSYKSCAFVSRGRFAGLESPDVEQGIHNKEKFRTIAEKLNLPIPETQNININKLDYPVIIKPVDSFSGQGITVMRSPNRHTFDSAIELAKKTSPTKEYIVERFIDGDLYSHNAFLKNQTAIKNFFVKENSTANSFVVDTSRVIFNPPSEMQLQIIDAVEKLARYLKLKDGLIHSQFIWDGSRVYLIDRKRAIAGDLYSRLIELSTGYPFVENYVRPFLGMPYRDTEDPDTVVPIMRHTVSVSKGQNFSHIRYKKSLFLESWVALSSAGDQLKPSPYSRVGILFARARSEADLLSLYEATIRRQLYEVVE